MAALLCSYGHEAETESLGSKVAKVATLVGGLAGVLTWRPSGAAAMVASLATSWTASMQWIKESHWAIKK